MLTSRNPTMRRVVKPNAYLEVDEMEKDDAILLLLRAAYLDESSEQDKAAASAIVDELHYLALAVDQAGAYIGRHFCQINQYLEIFSGNRIKLLDKSRWFQGASKYDRAVYTTFDISYEAIQAKQSNNSNPEEATAAENAITLLQIFSFFHYGNIMEEIFKRAAEEAEGRRRCYQDAPMNLLPWTGCDLPKDLLKLTRDHKWDSTLFKHAIQVLLSLSLLRKDSSGEGYSIHPLVHSWSRDRMPSSAVEKSAACASAVLAGSIDWEEREEDYTYRRKLIPHVNAYYEFARASRIVTLSKDDEFTSYGLVIWESGNSSTAEVLYESAMKMRMRVLGAEHPKTLISMSNLASTYSRQGRWTEAEELQVQVLEARKSVLGAEHPDTLISMGHRASTYSEQGRWKEAEKLQVQVLEAHKSVLGAEHPHTLISIGHLASTYSQQGRWKEAEELQVQVLKAQKSVLGVEHPHTLISMSRLTFTYSHQGRWKEAEKLQVQVLKAQKSVLGAEHPHTMISIGHLAFTYSQQGRWKEAEKLQMQVLEAHKSVLGAEHPHTLISMSRLTSTYSRQGRWKEAEELQVQVLEAHKSVLGAEHPDTLNSMSHLTSTYSHQGRWKEAEELQVQVLKAHKSVLGAEHPHTMVSINNLAVYCHSLGHRDKAIEMMTSVIDLCMKMIGPNHPYTIGSIKWLDRWTRTPPPTSQDIDATGTDETTSRASEILRKTWT